MNDDKYVDKCMALQNKMKKVLTGEDTNVGMNVMIVMMAGLITSCTKEKNHFLATVEVILELMRVVSQMSESFDDGMAEAAMSLNDVSDLLNDLDNSATKH